MIELLSLASRRRIYDHIEANSGTHLREIGRRCDVPLGTALYHLDRLESEGLVTVRRDGRYKRYFPTTGLGRREKDYLSAMRHSVPRRIAASLLAHGAQTQRELCGRIGVSRSTLSFHVNGLVERDIARREPTRPEGRYTLQDPDLVREILRKHGASLGALGPLREPAHAPVPVEA